MKRFFSALQTSSLIILLTAAISGCEKLFDQRKLKLTGRITDDMTGAGVPGNCRITVDGYNALAGWLNPSWKEDLGEGTLNTDGTFTISFHEWEYATVYYFNFAYANNSYINNGSSYLNTFWLDKSLFGGGSYSQNITAAKMTGLRINFRNLSPVNANDQLRIMLPGATDNILFGYLMPRWENLQFCTVDPMSWFVTGGANASGSLSANVPCDRKFLIRWRVRKNGSEQEYRDSVLCPRNMTTVYPINY